MAESRWQRWSRKKSEARKEVELTPPSTVEPEPAPEEQELAINEALPEHEVLKKYDLPDPDAIELGTDITGFMRKEIPELLRRKALRSLWKSNPVLAVLDGLNDYDEDFTDSAPGVKGAKTLYKVGKGFVDRTARAKEEPGEQVGDGIREQAKEESAKKRQEQVNEPRAEKQSAENIPEPGVATVDPKTRIQPSKYTEPVSPEADEEPAPRYRPRMRFD
ncbi:DUF3306 domain-containing protein [Marinobacter sp.]|uniref:DUF3306 domain-containing protein n=1 Tax=Marinobacter sp. TaxID=50741 RepID=UPI002352773F|nr:DUF3306 domain-containing protein [Marinobacter sp.]